MYVVDWEGFPTLRLCDGDIIDEVSRWLRGKGTPLPMQEMQVPSLGGEDLLKEEMATHTIILAWRSPRTEEPGELQSTESQKGQTRLSN